MIRKYLQLNTIFGPPPYNNSRSFSFGKALNQQIMTSPVHTNHPLYPPYQSVTVNHRLSVLLYQLETIVVHKGKSSKDEEKTLKLIMQTFHNMDVDTVKAKNLQNIIQIISGLQKTAKDSTYSSLITKMKQKLNILQNIKQQNSIEILIKIYMRKFDSERPVLESVIDQFRTCEIGQELINHLNQSSQIDVNVQSIIRFLEYIKKHSTPDYDRQIRIALLRKAGNDLGTYSKQEILGLAFVLNSISHYDFRDEQLKIVEQIFTKAVLQLEQDDKGSMDILSNICRRQQCLTNNLSLSNLLTDMIRYYLSTIKRYNSADAHQIFQLITVANERLKKGQTIDDKIEVFVLQYILISGKTKKHNKTINQALPKLIPSFFSSYHLRLLVEILAEIEFKMQPIVFYELANRNADVEKLKISFQRPKTDETVLLAVAFNINNKLSELKQAKQLKNQMIGYLIQPNFRIKLFQQILRFSPATALFKNFNKIFGQQVRTIFEQQRLPNLNAYSDIYSFFRYFIYSFEHPASQFQKWHEYLEKAPKQVIRHIIGHITHTQLNKNIGKLLYVLRSDQDPQKPWDKTFMYLFIKANQCLRQGLLTHDEQNQYWIILEAFLRYFLIQPTNNQRMQEYSHFLATIFRSYNNSSSDFLETGAFRRIFTHYFSPQIGKMQLFPQLRTIFTKYIIANKDLPADYGLSTFQLNVKQLDYTQTEILKSMLSKRYTPQIDKINESTLPIMLYNRNLHHLLKSRSAECIVAIQRSDAKGLANYVMSMCPHANQIYPQIACLIVDALATQINFATANMFSYLRALITQDLVLTPSCTEFMRRYLTYLTSTPNRTQDYATSLTILNIIKSQHLPKDLTNSYISQLLRKAGEYRGWQIRTLCQKLILTNYIFSLEQLELMSKIAPAKDALIYLDDYWNQSQRQRLIQRILQNDGNARKSFNRLQIRYFNDKYPQQSKKLKVGSIQPVQYVKNNPQYQEKLNQLATISKAKITTMIFYQDKVYSIRGKIVVFVPPFYRNSIHLTSFLERIIRLKLGNRTLVSVMFGFPQSYKHISETVRPPHVFTSEQWRDFFNNTPLTQSSQPQSNKNNDNSSKNSQSESSNQKIQFPDEESGKGETNKKSRRRRGFFNTPSRQIL